MSFCAQTWPYRQFGTDETLGQKRKGKERGREGKSESNDSTHGNLTKKEAIDLHYPEPLLVVIAPEVLKNHSTEYRICSDRMNEAFHDCNAARPVSTLVRAH